MKSVRNILCAALFVLSLRGGVDQQKLKPEDARKLAMAAMTAKDVESPDVTIDLDGEQSQCAVYHAYRLSKGDEPQSYQTFTVGWWYVDLRTAEVWDANSKRVTNQQIRAIQRAIRRRFGVTAAEIAAALSAPCPER